MLRDESAFAVRSLDGLFSLNAISVRALIDLQYEVAGMGAPCATHGRMSSMADLIADVTDVTI